MNILETLQHGEIEVEGRMPYSSNATFLVNLTLGDQVGKGIYKPLRGERPLWDFPSGLYQREVAAYLLSEAMDLHVIPPTVEREGPFGVGSLQWFIDARFEEHYFTLYEAREDLHDQFRNMAAFDIVANNTDRKGGHVLVDADDHLWGIDHGVCFSDDFKLRTVIWDFAGEDINDELLAPLEVLMNDVPTNLASLLTEDEIDAMLERIGWLLHNRVFPAPESRYQYPWPLL